MANIQLSAKGGNFMWRNILSHDPCHDWTPNGASKRLAKINNSFKNLENFSNDDSMSGGSENKRGKRSYVKFGGNKKNTMKGGAPQASTLNNDDTGLVDTKDIVGLYDEFHTNDTIFNTIYLFLFSGTTQIETSGQYILNNFNSLLGINKLDSNDMESTVEMYTRSKEKNRRMCIAQIQKACEFNDYNCINVISITPANTVGTNAISRITGIINNNSVIDPAFNDDPNNQPGTINNFTANIGSIFGKGGKKNIHKGGRDIIPSISEPIVSNIYDKTKLELDNNLNNKTATMKNNELSKQSPKKYEITTIFTYLKNEFNNYTEFDEDITEDIKQKMIDYYNCFEQSLLFYVKNIDSELPLFAIVNSHFIKDSLFIFLINLLLYDKDDVKELTKIEPSDEFFNEIIKMRNKDEKYITFKQSKGGSYQSGGAKIGTSDLHKLVNQNDYSVDTFIASSNIDINSFDPSTIYNAVEDKINNIMNTVNDDLFDPDMDTNNEIHNDIKNKLFHNTTGFFIKLWKKENCSHKIKDLQNKITNSSANQRALDRYKKTLEETIRNIYIKVHSALQKHYKLSSKNITFTQSDVNNPTTPSPTAVSITNEFLATLTKGIIQSSGSQYHNLMRDGSDSDGYKTLYEKEAAMLKNVVKKGKVENNLDSNLLNSFVDCVKKKHPKNYIPCGINDVISKLNTELYDGPKNKINIKIINNAMTTKNGNGAGSNKLVNIMIADKDRFEIKCPIPSIFDSQGTFGSCAGGTNAKGFITNNQIITINDEETHFEFGFEVNKPTQATKKTIMEYYAIYDGFTISNCIIDSVIQNNLLNILSANNTFKLLLDFMEKCWWENGGTKNWNIFAYNPNSTNQKLQQLIKIASRKMMGDFGQELTSVANNGGFSSILDWKNILLTNGDQPSTVRAGYMLLNNLGGVNSYTDPRTNNSKTRDAANVVFVTSKQGHIITGRPSSTRMWGGKNKKKKTLKNKQQKKKSNKKSKTKKIDYYINHIYNKNK